MDTQFNPSSPDTLELEARKENLEQLLGFIETRLEDCPMKALMQINVAAEEVFVNIASYAYAPGTGSARVSVRLQDDPRAALITFEDSGVEFDPLAKADPNVSLPASERSIGGLGIFMTKKLMDEVKYLRRDGKNILTLRKLL